VSNPVTDWPSAAPPDRTGRNRTRSTRRSADPAVGSVPRTRSGPSAGPATAWSAPRPGTSSGGLLRSVLFLETGNLCPFRQLTC
jgi:hypothetical protein